MNNKVEDTVVEKIETAEKIEKLTCGIIMPIAGMGAEYSADHWVDVLKIIHSAVEKAGFIPRIVSDSEESTVIHGSIINNIYNDAIVVCDVSNKNANVMFELGMRLAFNKPVVIIKDDKTDYSFDTSNIQHENYRKDLRHNTVEKFISDLSKKIKKTHEASLKTDYQTFLSYFGKFEVAKIENKSIGESEAIEKLLNKFSTLDSKITKLFHDNSFKNENLSISNNVKNIVIDISDYVFTIGDIAAISNEIKKSIFVVDHVSIKDKKLLISFITPVEIKEVARIKIEIDNIILTHFLPF